MSHKCLDWGGEGMDSDDIESYEFMKKAASPLYIERLSGASEEFEVVDVRSRQIFKVPRAGHLQVHSTCHHSAAGCFRLQ